MRINRKSELYVRARNSVRSHGLTPLARERAILYRMLRMKGGFTVVRNKPAPPKLDEKEKSLEDIITSMTGKP